MYAEKILSNVVDKNFAFPVLEYDTFNPLKLACVQQKYNLSTMYVHKRKNFYTVYTLDKIPKNRLAKIIKDNPTYIQWLKYNNIYFSLSSKILPEKKIKSKLVCKIVRQNNLPKIKRFRKHKIKVMV